MQKLFPQPALWLVFIMFTSVAYSGQSAPQHPTVEVENAFVRATPPGHKVTGAFMTLKNRTMEDIALIKADSAVAKTTEIHETSMKDGVMQMNQIDKITIPAEGSVELKPGGLHLMLIGLKKDLNESDKVTLELTFSDQSTQLVDVLAKKVNR